MSLNESYQTYTFRQIGGYAHGTFKDVTDKQAEEIKGHKKVKAAGERIVAGIIAEGAFARVPAEVSYMDENNTKWSYIDLKEGREPEGKKEIILDDAALELLGSPIRCPTRSRTGECGRTPSPLWDGGSTIPSCRCITSMSPEPIWNSWSGT